MSERGAALDYLRQAFAIDPIMEPVRLLTLRKHWLEGGQAGAPPVTARRELLELQDELIGVFWVLDAGEVDQRLNGFGAEPDLQRWGRRLAALDGDRHAFDALDDDREVPQLVARAIREVVLEPAARAVVARKERAHRLPRREAQRAAKRIRARHPEVYAHARAFVEPLLGTSDEWRTQLRQLAWVIVILVLAAVFLGLVVVWNR